MNRSIRRIATVVAVSVLLAASGCRRKEATTTEPSASASAAEALPPLVFKDDTPNALLTWIDEQGDFHVTEKVSDVPEIGRAEVRVVLADRKDGTGDTVYVANLQTKGADGAYAVKSMPRAAWDELGASKRKARLEALAPSAAPPPAASGEAPVAQAATGDVTAIIYGASWCGPCHQAEALLKSLGVKVTKKDVEKDEGAEDEMQGVLRRAHRHGGSIPVIDVMGQVFVGFSEGALRAAVQRAKSAR